LPLIEMGMSRLRRFKADVQRVYESRSSHDTRYFNVIRYQRES
jgi:hypothetical protein